MVIDPEQEVLLCTYFYQCKLQQEEAGEIEGNQELFFEYLNRRMFRVGLAGKVVEGYLKRGWSVDDAMGGSVAAMVGRAKDFVAVNECLNGFAER